MWEEIAFGNGRISTFQGLVTLNLYQVILHTVVPHSSTSTYMPNFIEIEETFCGRTDVHMGGRTFETYCIRSTWRSRPNNSSHLLYVYSSWSLLMITNASHNAVICIRSSTAKLLGVRSGTERIGRGNDFELIPTIKMETRHPVEIYFCREFPAICYHCGVLTA